VTCREQLEIEFLRRLMKRDAGLFADRTAALDNLVAREPVRRINSTYASEHPIAGFEEARISLRESAPIYEVE
jgi:hypothetical protein